jgi:protein O-mannosyl-transferase
MSAQVRRAPRPKASSKDRSFLIGNKLNAVLCVLLAAVTIALYSPVTGYSFITVWDDRDYVTANPHIHGGLAWSTIKWAFTSTEAGNWHPLTWLSHALDYQLFALNPEGHHLDSVLIHALNAALLFLLLTWLTKRAGPSLLVAALFALHPINVESVAWIAERKNVLSTIFFLLAIAAYAWYAQKPDWRRYLLVAAAFAAGLMAKPMVITLPLVLLLLDYWPLERTPDRTKNGLPSSSGAPHLTFSKLLLEKIPLFFLSAASARITLKAQQIAVRTFAEFPLPVRIENAVVAYPLYLWKMIWPTRLAALYPHPADTLPAWQVILSALILFGVTALVVAFRRKRYLPVGWFWFLGTLVPVIGLVQVGDAAIADRYAYVPLIGIFVMIAWGLVDLADAKKVRTIWRVVPALCVLTALGFATSHQLSYWDNSYDLWSHTLAVTEQNPFAHEIVAAALMDPDMTTNHPKGLDTEQKRMDEARGHYEEALKIRRELVRQNPDAYLAYLATTLNSEGDLDLRRKRMDEARQHFEEAANIRRNLTQQNPQGYRTRLATTLNNLGNVDQLQNRPDEARRNYEEALTLYDQSAQQNPDLYLPGLALTLSDLGSLDFRQKRMDDARGNFEGSLKIYRQLAQQNPDAYLPNVATTLNVLGFLAENQNLVDEARARYQEALMLLRKMSQGDRRYAGDMARDEAILRELDQKGNSR